MKTVRSSTLQNDVVLNVGDLQAKKCLMQTISRDHTTDSDE